MIVLALSGAALVLLAATVWLEALVLGLVRGQPASVAIGTVSHDPGALALAQLVGLGVPVLVAAWLVEGGPRAFVSRALAPVPWDRALAAFLAGLALQLPMVELSHLVTDLWPALRHAPEEEAALRETLRIHDLYSAIAVPMALVVLAPVTEELLFRAFAQRELALRLARVPGGRPLVIALVALFFAVFHMDGASVLAILVAGLALGAIADRWQSVRISIALHAGVNLVPVALTASVVPIEGFNDTDPSTHVAPTLAVASALVSAIAFGLAWRGGAPRDVRA